MSEMGLDLLVVISRDRRARRRAITIVGAFAAAGLLYAFLAPQWYRSTLTIVPTKSQSGDLASFLGGQLGSIASGLVDASTGGSDVQRIAAVLQSNAVSDAAIERFGLATRYREDTIEATRDALWDHCDVRAQPKPNLVELSCEDTDPQFAQRLAQFFSDYGNEVFRRVGVSSASEQVRFLERHVADLRTQANASAERMREFQEKYNIVDLETQAQAVVGAMASLNNQMISKELELAYAQTFTSSDEPTARQLKSQLALVNEKLQEMQTARATGAKHADRPGNSGLFPAALTVPRLRADFEKLYRDRKVSEATLVFALGRLESAKADEARDTSTFVILDPPSVPTRRARPKRKLVVLSALILGMVLSVAIESGLSNRQYLRRLLTSSGDEASGKHAA